MAFIPFKGGGKSSTSWLSVDNQGRIYLSASIRKQLGQLTGLYLYFEEKTRKIGVSKVCLDSDAVLFQTDNRFYITAKDFLNFHGIDFRYGAVRYYYDGKIGDVLTFKPIRQEGRIKMRFKQEKNGNLIRA